jgi:ABC-type multidrug transport system permease subunit
MNNIFLRQLKGFFLATLKIQLRNPTILILGFILPITIIFGYSYIVNNNFSKIRVGFVSKETTHYKKAVEYLNQNNRTFELKESNNELELNIALTNDQIDVKLWYASSGNPYIFVVSKDSNNLKNKLLEIVLTNEINAQVLKDQSLDDKVRTKVQSNLVSTKIGELLEPLLPVLLSFAILVCCISMSDLNIFNKKDNVALRRLFAAPSMPITYLLGQSFARVLFCLIQIMFMFVVMILLFGYQPPSILNILQIFLLVILVVCIFIQQNITLSAIIKRGRTLAVVNSVVLGMQFILITGLLPINNPSIYVKFIMDILPFGAFTKIINNITSGGMSLISWSVLPSIIILFGWFAFLSFVAKKSYQFNRD